MGIGRSVVGWLVAFVMGLTVALAAHARAAEQPPAVPMVLARTVRNGWGVSGRPGIDGSVAAYAAMLDMIHTRDIRSPLVGVGLSAARHWTELELMMQQRRMSSPKPRFTALVGAYLNDPATTWATQQRALLDVAGTGLLYAIEGPNEINNPLTGGGAHGPGDLEDKTDAAHYPANDLDWTRAICDFRESHAAKLRGVILVAPSIASGLAADYARLPDIFGFADFGNIHFYAGGGRQPNFSLPANQEIGSFDSIYAWDRAAQLKHGRLWLTETGASTSGNYAVDGTSQAKYIANQILEFFAAGGAHLFIHDLFDGRLGGRDVEGSFGLFHSDGSPKPAAKMLSALQDLLSIYRYDDPRNARDTAAFQAGFNASELKLSWIAIPSVTGPRALVLPKSDGSSLIAVWNEAAIDDGQGHALKPAAQSVTLDFGTAVRFSVHDLLGPDPATGTTPHGTRFDIGRSLTIDIRGYPIIVELSPPR